MLRSLRQDSTREGVVREGPLLLTFDLISFVAVNIGHDFTLK